MLGTLNDEKKRRIFNTLAKTLGYLNELEVAITKDDKVLQGKYHAKIEDMYLTIVDDLNLSDEEIKNLTSGKMQ